MMDCKTLENRFEALLDGTLSAAERRACIEHLDNCLHCSELKEVVDKVLQPTHDLEIGPVAINPPADLVSSILAHTSGLGCDRAQLLFGDLIDGVLPGTDRALVQDHLKECQQCSDLVGVWVSLARDLPQLAELPLKDGFVDDVLAATLPAGARVRRWWSSTWPQMLLRPRFALEAAYIGTLALGLIFTTTGSSLEAMPAKAVAITRFHPVTSLRGPVSALEDRISARLQPAWRSCRDKTVAGLDQVTIETEALLTQVIDLGGTLWQDFASLLERPEATAPTGSNISTKETQS
jgi:predicted anti-sigma-YlaC factor YlaD